MELRLKFVENLLKREITMSFKTLFQNTFYNELFTQINSYVYNSRESLNISSYSIDDIKFAKLDDFSIKSIHASNKSGDFIVSDLLVIGFLNIGGHGRFGYEKDSAEIWLSVKVKYLLTDGLHQFSVLKVKPYVPSSEKGPIPYFSKEFVPYVSAKNMDSIAEDILEQYYPEMLQTPMALPIYNFVRNIGVEVEEGTLSSDGSIFGEMVFKDSLVIFFDGDQEKERTVKSGTVLVDPQVKGLRNQGSFNNTIIHECVHWLLHRTHNEYKSLLGSKDTKISSRLNRSAIKEDKWSTYDWMEWQANGIAARILMPRKTTKMMVQELFLKYSLVFDEDERITMFEQVIDDLAYFFQVSRWAVKIRMMQLGFTEFEGIYKYVGNEYIKSYTCEADAIQNNQTFTISFNNACFLNFKNERFRELMDSGKYVYVDSHFCLNSEKYVQMVEYGVYQMTDYAYSHMDECCLIFDIHYAGRKSISYKDFNDYILYRGNLPELKIEIDFSEHIIEVNSIPEYSGHIFSEIQRIMESLPNHFCGTLRFHRDRKDCSREQLEEYSGVSVSTIERMETKHGENGKLKNIIAVCIGLKLYPDFSFDLIGKSTHSLSDMIPHHSAYKMILRNCYHLSVEEVNEKLKSMNIETI
jgi:transcriptional regulator with XRE-family HTH domain